MRKQLSGYSASISERTFGRETAQEDLHLKAENLLSQLASPHGRKLLTLLVLLLLILLVAKSIRVTALLLVLLVGLLLVTVHQDVAALLLILLFLLLFAREGRRTKGYRHRHRHNSHKHALHNESPPLRFRNSRRIIRRYCVGEQAWCRMEPGPLSLGRTRP